MTAPLLVMKNVTKSFSKPNGETFKALDDVSIELHAGEIVALVGESGSGKSTLGRVALGLTAPDAGQVLLEDQDISSLTGADRRRARTLMQPVFQDPGASLNPRRNVRDTLAQASVGNTPPSDAYSISLLESVGLVPGVDFMERLPHEMSGGQKQRLTIARALASSPKIILADEALSGADVSIRGQVLNLFLEIAEERKMSYLMITHDISVARALADRVYVMRFGRIVEAGSASEVLSNPQEAYTRELIDAVPFL